MTGATWWPSGGPTEGTAEGPAGRPTGAQRAAVHAGAASRLGAANPRQEGPPDLRLVGPALAAWAAAAAAPAVGAGTAIAGLAALIALSAAVVAAPSVASAPPVAAVAAALRGGPGRRGRGPARCRTGPTGLLPAAIAMMLCGAVAAMAAALEDADLTRGPVPSLARHRAGAEVAVRVTGDPFAAEAGAPHPVVVVPATVERVGPTRLRTPVVVMATGAADDWLRLVPSTRLTATARFAPDERGQTAAVLRVRGVPRITGPPTRVQRLAARLRGGLRKAAAPLPADVRGLLPGLVVGDTAGLPEDLKEAFKATDLAHLTAVSGANLTIVLILLIGPPGLATRSERRGLAARLGLPLRWTAVLGAALTAAFVLVCRPSPSVLRAAVCGLITLLAIGTGRRRSLLPALAGAVLLLVLYEPELARSFGFALSVLATGSLLTLAPRWGAALHRHGLRPRLAEALAAAAAAQAACGPVIVLLSARLSLVAVPCNLLAEPAVGPATVLGFGALAVAPLAPSGARVLAWLAGWPTRWIVSVARHGAALPGAELAWPGGWPGAALLAVVTAAAVVCGRSLLRRPWLCAGAAIALLLALVRPVPLPRVMAAWPPGDWRFAMCDVGQGDALALSTGPGAAVVVDTGPDPTSVDRCLRDLRVTSIPLLILTHFHADHVDGLPGALRGRRVGAIETTLLDDPPGQAARVRRQAAAAGVPLLRVVPGEERAVGPLSWRTLWPAPGPAGLPAAELPAGEPNDTSIALLVHDAGLTLLLMGDLEPDVQAQVLAERPGLPRVDVLKVAHHGSAYQDPALLARARPRLALISVGAGNSYGHPAPRTVTALRTLGAVVLRTDLDGPIAVSGATPADLRTSFVPHHAAPLRG
ncbi:ComEC/Rec2 family competence protein [Streptomyces sp. NBC_00669]|uniref:ComEC/Rec2 family competence protein n=1 Tax=Streptomyces sp. NBC_00669 TaxID=2976011 RepID=UPI002E2EAC26|nr:ComEC/Rec2 family competence protein [Streptomyces sp. NBC_00669]